MRICGDIMRIIAIERLGSCIASDFVVIHILCFLQFGKFPSKLFKVNIILNSMKINNHIKIIHSQDVHFNLCTDWELRTL